MQVAQMMQVVTRLQEQVETLQRQMMRQTTGTDSRLTSAADGISNSSIYNTPSESPNPIGTHTRRVCMTATQPVIPPTAETPYNSDPAARGRFAYLSDFKGEDPRQWIHMMEGHFRLTKVPEEYKLEVAQRYISGNVMSDWFARGDLYPQT